MKKYLISSFVWYLILSFGMFVIWLLTGITGLILIRVIVSLILGYFKPIQNLNLPFK
jgi:hypothetical protein